MQSTKIKKQTPTEKQIEAWKSTQLRVVAPGKSQCCDEEMWLVQTAAGKFVKSMCSGCRRTSKLETISLNAFLKEIDLSVSCPKCGGKMEKDQNSNKNYVFQCCDWEIALADVISSFTEA